MAAQKLGLSLARIAEHMEGLPPNKAPNKKDWERISKGIRHDINQRINALEALRDQLDGCIGCGCLSLDKCSLYNPDDIKGQDGIGPQLLPDIPE